MATSEHWPGEDSVVSPNYDNVVAGWLPGYLCGRYCVRRRNCCPHTTELLANKPTGELNWETGEKNREIREFKFVVVARAAVGWLPVLE